MTSGNKKKCELDFMAYQKSLLYIEMVFFKTTPYFYKGLGRTAYENMCRLSSQAPRVAQRQSEYWV